MRCLPEVVLYLGWPSCLLIKGFTLDCEPRGLRTQADVRILLKPRGNTEEPFSKKVCEMPADVEETGGFVLSITVYWDPTALHNCPTCGSTSALFDLTTLH